MFSTRTIRTFLTLHSRLWGSISGATLSRKRKQISGLWLGKVKAPETYIAFFDTGEIDVTERSIRVMTEANWISSNYRIDNVGHLARLINVEKERGALRLNYNCEAGNLAKDMSKLRLLMDGYDKFCEEFSSFVRHLEA